MAINEALAEYLALYHKGEANAVTSRELECSFQMRGSELRREINALRGDGIPICSFERLPCVEDVDLLRNILYSGVWLKYNCKRAKNPPRAAE